MRHGKENQQKKEGKKANNIVLLTGIMILEGPRKRKKRRQKLRTK